MPDQAEHPSIKRFHERVAVARSQSPVTLDAGELRHVCLELGADDVGFVEVDRAELGRERGDILGFFPQTKSLVSFVVRMNREPIRNPARSVANVEFEQTGEHVNQIVSALEARGIRAINPAMGFPMEVSRGVGTKLWVVSHKTVAVAAGLGQMGIHRNVIHPRFGNFTLLGTAKLKQQDGNDLVIYGHGLLTQTLPERGLLDELKFWIHPLFVGRGESLFREGNKIKMKLAATRTLATGVVVLTYQR
jgi:hypothetical protein